MILGPTGVGKTLLGYRFLACSTPAEKGVLFSFYETPKRALAKADGIGLDLTARCQEGDLEIIWQSPVESSLDAVGGRIIEAVERSKAARLFIDGFDALQNAAAYPERVPQFFAALGRELHARGVTVVHSAELRAIFAPQIEAPVRGISPLLENLVLLRFVERRARVLRVISVLKMRDSDFDSALHELKIEDHGIVVAEPFREVEAVLTGVARTSVSKVPQPPPAAPTSPKRKTGSSAGKSRAKPTRRRG